MGFGVSVARGSVDLASIQARYSANVLQHLGLQKCLSYLLEHPDFLK